MGNTFLVSILIIFHFLTTTSSRKFTSIITDQSALLMLKHNVVHDPQNLLTTNWSASTPVCSWFGISCGSRHRRVTAINLHGLGLVGTFPAHLGNMTFLSFFSVSTNNFHGRLPVELSDLRRLKHIQFGNNIFDGEIPSWIGSLTQLRSLNLSHNNFQGAIPFSLGYLPKLERLILFENRISGPIPSSIFNISSLQKVNLRNNNLTGSIPSVSRDLLSLETIDFSYNNLVGHIPKDMFDHTPKLTGLLLSTNQLSDTIPSSLFKCKQLKFLSLSYNYLEGSLAEEIGNLSLLLVVFIGQNHFEGEIPKQIVNLTFLEVLDCSYNNFTGIIPHQIGNLKALEWLNLGYNHLVGPIPPAVFDISTLFDISLELNQLSGHLPPNTGLWLPNLEELYLGVNQLVGPFPMYISNASQLVNLDMSHNYFSGSIPDSLGNLRSLEKLNLMDNRLSFSVSSFLDSLTSCRGLKYLVFGGSPLISGELPGLVGNLSGSLEDLYASDCSIRGSIPSEIGNLSRLITIEIAKNELTGTIPAAIGRLKELQSLSLIENKLERSIPFELCHLNKLAFLFLMSNKLSGPIPSCLGNLTSLRNLYLGSNMFSSSIPSTLTGLNDLLILNLSSNLLTGAVPVDIGKWKVLYNMDLSNNLFSSDIPTGVKDLKELAHFALSNNRITGSIPEFFGDLSSLEFLDLSKNNLSGVIPKSLEKLSYLKYFNVSYNRLEGEIPEQGSFGNFTIESFKGNAALCGAARFQVPSCKTRSPRNSKASKHIMYVALPIASTILVAALIIIILRSRKSRDKLPTQQDLMPVGSLRRFSYHELHRATDGFSDSRLLGNGCYGSVYQGTLPDGMTIAVKVFKLELEGALKSFDVECEVLRNTRHRNLIKIISSCSNNLDFKALVLEFMPNGSLDKWLHSNNQFLDIVQRMNIMIDVAAALEYLHQDHTTPVVHCDLKPSNVLLDEDMVAHVSDFGIAKLLCEKDSMIQTITIATFGYMAPEYGSEGMVSTKGDVYSFGILMMEVMTRKKPTDEMFTIEASLRSWVNESLPCMLNRVVDTNLLSTNGREHMAANNCALSVLQVALECSAELPNERLDIREVLAKLKKIKGKLFKDIGRV